VDWDDLRVFLQVARSGQMAAAARLLGLDHSTISRRIARLEGQVGATLFDRAARRISITAHGSKLVAAVEKIESVVLSQVMGLGSDDREVTGRVRVGTSEGFGAYYLAQRLPLILEAHPGLEIELVALPQSYSLAAREVDVVITMDRPDSGNLRFRKLSSYDLGIYGTSDYFDRYGRPNALVELPNHRWCGYIKAKLFTDELDLLNFQDFVITPSYQTMSLTAQLEAILGGRVLGVLPCYMAKQRNGLVRVLQDEVTLVRDYWLAVHEDVANVARVRAVIEAIDQQIRSNRGLFSRII
jgi:DNA-binding transcriptional LysR family regulator